MRFRSIIFWVLVAVVTNVFLPSLDDVTADNAGPLVARDAPSAQAAIHQGNDFDESNYTSVAVLLLETQNRKLDEGDHQYYNEVIRRLLDDTKHVASVQDLWGKPVTMSGSQSADAEATTLTIRPVGDLGSSEANKSIDAIRDDVAKVPKPDGLTAYVTGPAPLASDTLHATDKSLVKLTIVTVILIVVLLLIVYRSITIALIPLFGVLTTLAAARGIISFLVGQGAIEISSFASNLLVSLVLGASTDFLPRSIPGSASKRRSQGIVLLRVHRQRAARHHRVGYCDLGRHAVPEPDASGLLPHARPALFGVDGCRRPRRADPGPGATHRREQDRLDPAEEETGPPGLAQGRYRYRPMAGADDALAALIIPLCMLGGRPTT